MNNKAEVERRIKELIKKYAPEGTRFSWSSSERAFGQFKCKRRRSTGELWDFRISISWPLASINSWERIEETVYHEIAHSLTPGHGHDYLWRATCNSFGIDGRRCFRSIEEGGDTITPAPKYIGTCPVCGKQFPRNRRSYGAYHCSPDRRIVWEDNKARVA